MVGKVAHIAVVLAGAVTAAAGTAPLPTRNVAGASPTIDDDLVPRTERVCRARFRLAAR